MPAQQGGGQVCGAEDVEPAREDGSRDAVEDRGDPGHLRFVDGEVRGDGAVEALGGEDGVGVAGFGGLGCSAGFGGGGLEGDGSGISGWLVLCGGDWGKWVRKGGAGR